MTRSASLGAIALSAAVIVLCPRATVALGDRVEAGSCAIANSGSASGNSVTCNFDMPPEKLKELIEAAARGGEAPLLDRLVSVSKTLGVTQDAAKTLLKIVGKDPNIPDDKVAEALSNVADDYKKLQAELAALNTDNPTAKAFVEQAKPEIEAGHFQRARELLAIATDQVQAVRLIDDGQPDRAITLLDDVEQRLNKISADATAQDLTQRGYSYKTYAEASFQKGEKAAADKYLDLAYNLFVRVRNDSTASRDDLAGAINGIGNIHAMRGQYPEAIADYRLATDILPNYAYAWHDMFLAYAEMAKLGHVDLAGTRHALDETKANARGWPGLDADYLTRLDAVFNQYAPRVRQNEVSKVRH